MDHHSGETDEWVVEIKMGIQEIRLLYHHINDSLYGPYPKKSVYSIDQLAYLRALKNKLFAIICEYSYDMEEFDK
ncbi:hypothetical protein PSSM2_139 [Prochlorococcus phage P-SSM2]|jgi:hypothetical protein|uniref:Uncharacterized protein n=2 Tax=Salacisavirus pssm2 TaxID=2734140 RepID=Q58ML5_BPPRM|nr:hypothetical protein PSSM2_139 [Prochlorococcus phage P-SSM2]AAX44517.1 hypothetical protein PSSM2_139 [Prochlorococcus phage P-SSM2]ACY76018.1 conserved hypothetical protein [Prochlorococcus phage P-SSM2]AGN12450.1 hypothetical protein PRTG_00302 [Prochlorococcus phage P-SSM5]